MVTARDIMTANPITISPQTSITDAVNLLLEKRFNGLPVVDENGALLGVLCKSDLVAQQKTPDSPSIFSILDGFISFGLKQAEKDLQKITALTAGEAMTKSPVTVTPDTTLDQLAAMMVKAKLYSLPVLENGKLVGIIGKEDILRTVVGKS